MLNRMMIAAVAGLAALAVGAAVSADPAPAPKADAKPAAKRLAQCFYSHDWNGWRATPDSKSMYIRVGVNRVYRVDFSDACYGLNDADAHLVTKSVTDSVCSAIDLDVKVADSHGFRNACIVSNITPLTDVEAKALPPKLKP